MDNMNQTPQPSKVALMDENNPIPEETYSQEFNLPPMAFPNYELQNDQLSHSEQPPNCYPQQLEKPLMKSSLSKRHFSPSTGKTPRGEKEAVGELLTILVDCMDELNTKSRESLLRKFFSEIERDERLEKFIVKRLTQSKVKAISDLYEKLPSSVRGKISRNNSRENYTEEDPEASTSNDGSEILSCDDVNVGFSESVEIYGTFERSLIESVEDLSQELERFKVRTLEVGGIGQEAQEEGKK